VRASSKLIWYVSLVRQVWLEDVDRVSFHTMEKVIVGGLEQVVDGQDVVAAVSDPFGASQQRIKMRLVGSRTHPRPCWRRVLKPRDDCGAEYVV